MLIPSVTDVDLETLTSLSRRVNANSQLNHYLHVQHIKLIKKGEC